MTSGVGIAVGEGVGEGIRVGVSVGEGGLGAAAGVNCGWGDGVPSTCGVKVFVGGFVRVGVGVGVGVSVGAAAVALTGDVIEEKCSIWRVSSGVGVGRVCASGVAVGIGVGVIVGVAVSGDSPGRLGGVKTPIRISIELRSIARINTAMNGNSNAIARGMPSKDANVRFVFCCWAAAVRNADLPGRNP